MGTVGLVVEETFFIKTLTLANLIEAVEGSAPRGKMRKARVSDIEAPVAELTSMPACTFPVFAAMLGTLRTPAARFAVMSPSSVRSLKISTTLRVSTLWS